MATTGGQINSFSLGQNKGQAHSHRSLPHWPVTAAMVMQKQGQAPGWLVLHIIQQGLSGHSAQYEEHLTEKA